MRTSLLITALLLLSLLASACVPAGMGSAATAAPAAAPAATSTTASPGSSPVEPTATVANPAPVPTALALGNLTVEEYPIVAEGVDTPDHIEFAERIAPAVLETRQAWRTPLLQERVAAANDGLASFGYKLVPQSEADVFPCDLYQAGNVIEADVDAVWPISVAASGSDFCLVVETPGGDFLVRNGSVEAWDPGPHASIAPVLVGEDLVSVDAAANGTDWDVRRSGEVVYTVRDEPVTVSSPVKGLWSWDGHWVLEVNGHVIIDGQDLDATLGYDEIFSWQLLAGQPFYLFKKDGRIGVSYAGQALAPRYDDVVHYECCEASAFNVAGNRTMVWAYALRDGMWEYVEMGVYR